MTKNRHKLPSCFGELEVVFPIGENDLRQTPDGCMACLYTNACLKSALNGADGLKVREEFVDRAYASGMISFLERWSTK